MRPVLPTSPRRHDRGFTLMEISLVIALVLALMSLVGLNYTAVEDWQQGKDASLSLQAVFSAQRAYMADHPTAAIATVTSVQLVSYLPEGWSSMPTFTGLSGQQLTLDHTVMPPRLLLSNTVYDPSGNSSDGLWDADQ